MFSKTTKPIKAKFRAEPPWERGTKVYINGSGHMTKMAFIPKYGKIFQNLFLQNRKSCELETWHAISGTEALQIYVTGDSRLTLTYFTARSNLVALRLM